MIDLKSFRRPCRNCMSFFTNFTSVESCKNSDSEDITQTGDGVQGGHAADGNCSGSVKVASQAWVGWKFLVMQLMHFLGVDFIGNIQTY